MRKRFSFIGYSFFFLLTITGLIVGFSLFERISSKPLVTRNELVNTVLSDTKSDSVNSTFILENISKDFDASLENFHMLPNIDLIADELQPSCTECHSLLPHNKEIKTRAFINMHTKYIACETCHQMQHYSEYKWVDIKRNIVVNALPENIPLMAIQLVGVEDSKPKYVAKNSPDFKLLASKTNMKDLTSKNKFCKTNYNQDISTALKCNQCHTDSKSFLDWETLGYTEEQILKLQSLSIPSTIHKYKEFIIPQL